LQTNLEAEKTITQPTCAPKANAGLIRTRSALLVAAKRTRAKTTFVGFGHEPVSASPLFDALSSTWRVPVVPLITTALHEFLLSRITEDERRVRDLGGGMTDADAPMNPARLLYECTAKRMIVAVHSISPAAPTTDGAARQRERCAHDGTVYPCLTLRALALPYADHPDFRVEWRA
jgi:hypothetical protein